MLPLGNGFVQEGAVSDLCQVLGPVEINGRGWAAGNETRASLNRPTLSTQRQSGTQPDAGEGRSKAWGGFSFKLPVSCSDLQSRWFKIERGGRSMTDPKRLEIKVRFRATIGVQGRP